MADMYDHVESIDGKMSTANTLNAAQLALQQEATRMQAESNRLLDEANRQREETNRRLSILDTTQQRTLKATQSVRKAVEDMNTTIREQTTQVEQLLNVQNGKLDDIRDSIDRQTVNQAYQSYAMWRQTPDGRAYLEWENTAKQSIVRMTEWTRRMADARQADIDDQTRLMLADEIDRRNRQGPPRKPEFPPVEKVRKPAEFTEPEPTGDRSDGIEMASILICVIIAIVCLVFKISNDYYPGIGFFTMLFKIVGWGFLYLIVGLVAGFFIGIIIATFAGDSEEDKAAKENWRQRKEAHDEDVRRYEENQKIRKQQQQEYNEWRDSLNQWLDIDTDAMARQAKSLTPQPTHWASENPMPLIREWTSIISNVMYRMPDPQSLPSAQPPAFAEPDGIPDTAPRMRAELERIIVEESRTPLLEADEQDTGSM